MQVVQISVDSVILNMKNLPHDYMRSNWFFTLNNYTRDDIVQLCTYFSHYVFQEEIGKNGTPHLQGCCHKRSRFSSLKIEFPRVHWEVCKNLSAAKKYCTKLDTRNGKIYTKGFDIKKQISIIDYFENKTPYLWQQNIIDMLDTIPDERKVYWYWDVKGNIGKSALTRHLLLHYNVLAVSGNARDIKCAYARRIDDKVPVDMVILDIPRSSFNNISYKSIEEIKNGFFFSSKYESKSYVFNIPHLIVFANSAPDISMLSRDRWIIIHL